MSYIQYQTKIQADFQTVSLHEIAYITIIKSGGVERWRMKIVRHYSGYIAALSTRTSYGPDGCPRPQVDEDLRGRLEAKLIISILDFDLS